jgi:hypothetical protein
MGHVRNAGQKYLKLNQNRINKEEILTVLNSFKLFDVHGRRLYLAF